MRSREFRILMVEDNPADVVLMMEALKDSPYSFAIEVVADGERAVERLQGELPDLVILDLNLPRLSGHEVLQQIRASQRTALVPVIVMSGSNAVKDIERAYELHANCYVRKPGCLDELFHVVKTIERVWLQRVSLPTDTLSGS